MAVISYLTLKSSEVSIIFTFVEIHSIVKVVGNFMIRMFIVEAEFIMEGFIFQRHHCHLRSYPTSADTL